MMDVPHLQGVEGVAISSGRKRKRKSCSVSTPEFEIGKNKSNPSNALEVDGAYPTNIEKQQGLCSIEEHGLHNGDGEEQNTYAVDQSNTLEVEEVQIGTAQQSHPSNTPEHVEDEFAPEHVEDEFAEFYGDDLQHEVAGDGEEYEDVGWDGDDMDNRAGCVEGRINPEMFDGFLQQREKNRKFRSKVWTEFTKIRVAGIVTKGQCIHCNVEISAKRGAGTSAMSTHLKRCRVRKSVTNVARQLKSVVISPEGVSLENWRFSQDVFRKELARMISLHGLPLSIVDYDGFRRFVSSLNPVFRMISRRTITEDCLKIFQEQKQALQDVFRSSSSRISLTMDMWTSNQTIGYMCITCHFLGNDWKLNKRIIKFSFMKTPHTGVAMFNEVLKSIQEWNIEDKLFAITLDNASNNNSMVRLLRSNLLEKNLLCGKGKLLHQRCAAHVINLICKAGFETINQIVYKIRESVKYVEGSASRKQKFEELIQQLGITYEKRPNIDVCTRWNSTYLMLETSLQLKRAFESLTQQDSEYTSAPSPQEWEKASTMCSFLKTFYDATKVISGSLYPTSNLYFHEIWEVKVILDNGAPEENVDLIEIIKYMQKKFKKYWKLTWLQISFPVIFDPRFKLEFVNFRLKQAFGNESDPKIAAVKKVLLELFKDYSELGNQNVTQQVEVITSASGRYADWDQHMIRSASSTNEVPSELETYLAKPPILRNDSFDILSWWKSNSVEYPTLSRMARDVLATPASTVASESAFSLGKRIISDFRSRLTPKNVEALVCLQDWTRASGSSNFCMKSIEDFIELTDHHECHVGTGSDETTVFQ